MRIGFEDVCASVLRVIYSGTQTTPSSRGDYMGNGLPTTS